jgi:serine/threonine-protein kinase RsbW
MEHRADIAAPPSDVNSVHDLLDLVWRNEPQVSTRDRLCFETALIELASNVIAHGDAGEGVRFQIAVRVLPDRIEADLLDDAADPHLDSTGPAMPETTAESGRGLALIQSLVDEMHHANTREGNSWRIVRTMSEERV